MRTPKTATKCARKSTNSTRKSKKTRKSDARPFLSPRKPVQNMPRAFKFGEALFFFTKFTRMGNHAAARPPRWVLHMQHFVEQNISHRARRNARTIHPAIQQNLIWSG